MDLVDFDELQKQKEELTKLDRLENEAGALKDPEFVGEPTYKPIKSYLIPEEEIEGPIRV